MTFITRSVRGRRYKTKHEKSSCLCNIQATRPRGFTLVLVPVHVYKTLILCYTCIYYIQLVQIIISSYSFFQPSSTAQIWLDELRCLGSESRLIDCPANTIGIHDCEHSEDVTLVCSTGKKQMSTC